MSDEKVLLLTGASGGVGRNIIKGLSDAGYRLALHYHDNFKELAALLDEVKPKTKIGLFQADLRNEEEIREMAASVFTEFGRIDVLVNNAGTSHSAMSWKQETDDWNDIIALNLTAPFLMCKYFVPYMRAQEYGRIINVSSVVAHIGMPGTTAYAASKSGLEGFTRSLAKEVVGKNITANSLAYGYMEAGMIDVLNDDMKAIVRAMIPANTFGPTDDILSAILYLADEKSTYVTGQTLHINGGMFMG
jgi:NAD(P)-dependent dehydrogenase (short-subunit alcohol dehydrogenase family)